MTKYALPIIAFSTGVLAIAGTHFPSPCKHISGTMFLPASATGSEILKTSVNTRRDENLTPQEIAAFQEELSEMGFDQNSYGQCLVLSAKNHNLAHVRILISLNADGKTPLFWANHKRHRDCARLIREAGGR